MTNSNSQPCIAFGRTKIALSAMASGILNEPVIRIKIEGAMTGINTVIAPATMDFPIGLDHLEYREIVSVNPIMASATPIEITDEDEANNWSDLDDGDEDDDEDEDGDYEIDGQENWPSPTQERQSSKIERQLYQVGISEHPVFGRRLLLVNYESDLTDGDMQRAKERLRRRLGSPVAVWQGRSFEAYCFVDNSSPDRILMPLRHSLDCAEVEDYLLVQPIRMLLRDDSGLSPLGDWLDDGWRAPRASKASRKT